MDSWMVEEPKWHWMMHQLLSRFQQQGTLCDTTLACSNGEAVKAHSCVLAAASQRIRALLDGVQSGDYTLQMGSVTSSTWRYILRFIYDGRVSLPSSEIQHVKDAAVRFQIVPLVELIQALERLQTREGANRRENFSVQPCSSEIIVLEDDDEIVNEITDLNVSSNQSASVNAELSCVNSSCLEPVNSDVLKAVNVSESLYDIEMDEAVHQSHDSSVTVANLQTEASLSGHNESTVDDERPVDVSDVFENGRPHDTKCDRSVADVKTRSSPAEIPLQEGRNESSDILSKLIVPVSCFANNLNSEVEPQDSSSSQPSAAGFSHSKREFSGDSVNFELTQSSHLSSGDNRTIVCQTTISAQSCSGALLTYSSASGMSSRQTILSRFSTLPVSAARPHITGYNLQHPDLSPAPMDLTDRADDEEPLLCISDVVSLSAQNTKFGDDKTEARCASSSSCEDRAASYALSHQAMLPVPAPIVSKSELISGDQLRSSVIKSRIVQGGHVSAAKGGIFDLEKRNPTLTAMFKEKSDHALDPAPWPVLLVSRPEIQNSNEIAMNTTVMHDDNDDDDDDDADPSIIRPHVIEPIDDDGSPSSQPESQTLHDDQTNYLCGIAPTSLSLSYITVPVQVQGFSTAEDLPAASLRMTPSFSASQPSVITSQQPTAPTLDSVPCKFKQPALLRHSSKNHFSFFTGGTQTPRKQAHRGKKGSVTNKSTDFGLNNTVQKTLSSAALGSFVTGSRPDVLEYAWPGDGGQFSGCSKLLSDGVNMYRTPADQSSSTVKHRRRKRAFKNIRSDEHLGDGLMLAPEFGTATDHNYFMQPDSTVSDSQTLQSRTIDVYSFTDSETCGSGEKKSPPSVKGAFKTTKRPRNKQCHEKNSPTKLQPDDSNKSQEPMKRKRGRCRKIPSEEQSLSRPSSSGIQFVGKEILHEWVVSNNPRTTEWFRGKVIRLVKGTDGEPGCQYEVQYKDDDTYIVDHLLDDYKDGSIKFYE